ncbi:hypothetical protein CLV98_11651 [Dyadobacter jejuensis]|uniref:Uncharacterized protein n=1 Tax=Dyadobacter jejuensis TaxID=1082580 RepID=A0A316AD02_9BACT|nr:hypothetical protein [Dyadobacter jejuensis]PWJ54764.1 hypothetical protein CLV98_11651 [Dyadobacter jejuensis]
MKDLSNPGNTIFEILPPFYHSEFSPEFLQLTLSEISPELTEPGGRFHAEFEKLGTEVFDRLLDFLAEPCRGAEWCPPLDLKVKVKEILDHLP